MSKLRVSKIQQCVLVDMNAHSTTLKDMGRKFFPIQFVLEQKTPPHEIKKKKEFRIVLLVEVLAHFHVKFRVVSSEHNGMRFHQGIAEAKGWNACSKGTPSLTLIVDL